MKRHLLLLCLIIGMGSLMAQGNQNFWQSLDPSFAKSLDRSDDFPLTYKAFSLNFDQIKSQLKQTPLEKNAQNSTLRVTVPGPENQWMDFDIVETLVMPASLGAQYPEIKTFYGTSASDPYTRIRLDFTYMGFHAKITSPDYIWWVEPVQMQNTQYYLGYYQKDASNLMGFECGVEGDDPGPEIRPNGTARNNIGAELRTYRLALASDESFTAFRGGVTNAISDLTTYTNFLNDVTEVDLGLRFQLVPNNNNLVFDANTDPYTSNNLPLAGSWVIDLLNENPTRLNSIIGSANYDVGHILSGLGSSNGVGGIASIRALCNAGTKGRGLSTNGFGSSLARIMEIFTHEVGHQMGANHSFHSTSGACGGNRSASAAYEVGNGTTIMGYPGCEFVDQVDFYFHVHSFQEIYQFTTQSGGTTCPVVTNTGNSPPEIIMPAGGFTIPANTPFVLSASATDPDGDALTYGWEQYDRGNPSPITAPAGNVPIFRSYPAVADSFRFFPRMAEILTGSFTQGERLPSYSRSLTFRLMYATTKLVAAEELMMNCPLT